MVHSFKGLRNPHSDFASFPLSTSKPSMIMDVAHTLQVDFMKFDYDIFIYILPPCASDFRDHSSQLWNR